MGSGVTAPHRQSFCYPAFQDNGLVLSLVGSGPNEKNQLSRSEKSEQGCKVAIGSVGMVDTVAPELIQLSRKSILL